MDSNCKPWQQAKLKHNKELIRQVLATEIPRNWVPATRNDFFEFVASHVHLSRSALIRAGSQYREMILTKYDKIKHAHGLLEDDKREIASLSSALSLKELELSNSKSEIQKLKKILKNMGDPRPTSGEEKSKPEKNYRKEFEEVCRALRSLLNHIEPLGITPNSDYSIVDGCAADGSIMIVVDCAHMKAYAGWDNGKM